MFHQRTKSKHGVHWHCRAPASLRSTSAHAQVMMAHIEKVSEKGEKEGLRRVAEGRNHKLVKES